MIRNMLTDFLNTIGIRHLCCAPELEAVCPDGYNSSLYINNLFGNFIFLDVSKARRSRRRLLRY